MREAEDFFSFVRPLVAGVPDMLMEQRIVLAAREFCRRTRMWRETNSFDVVTDAVVEALGVTGEITSFEIERVWFNGAPLEASAYSTQPPGDDPEPWIVAMPQPNTLLLRAPSDGTFKVSFFVQPSPTATLLPDFLFDQHVETIAAGAAAALLAMPNKEWSNPQLAAVHQAIFERDANRNFNAQQRGSARARTRMRFSDV